MDYEKLLNHCGSCSEDTNEPAGDAQPAEGTQTEETAAPETPSEGEGATTEENA